MLNACPVCRDLGRTDILSLHGVPVLINAQVRPDEADEVPRGDVDLVVCHGCGHLYNRSFDEALLDYDASYENTLHFSASFREFAAGLADRLVADHDLVGEAVAEFGSGPGHFLSMLCKRGVARGLGFDPSYDADRLEAPDHRDVVVSSEPFPDAGLSVALACSQHVLEHLHDPVAALRTMRSAVESTAGAVYSEVPNGELMIDQCALWDVIYEHLSYFVPSSLETAHRRAGLRTERTDASFGDQFLWCESRPTDSAGPHDPNDATTPVRRDELVTAAIGFGERATARLADARNELVALSASGPVVLWGAGSKGMTYLNVVDDDRRIAGVVDINPRKAGWGVPGTGHVIGGPDEIVALRPATVLLANPVYATEVAAQLAELGSDAVVRPLWS